MSFFGKLFGKKEKESLDEGLQKTREGFLSKITKAIAGKSTVDEEVLDKLEDALVSADVGIDTTIAIIEKIEKRVARDKYINTGSDTLRTDNDLPLNDGIFGYRIRAKENSGGNDGESYSNIIELTQNPILYAPNAFSPNGDNDNETWGVERAFVKDYSIDLYNRWGQLIFQSTNTQERWDGTFKGTAVPQGVYFYKMRFTGYNDRKVFEKLGSITVVR